MIAIPLRITKYQVEYILKARTSSFQANHFIKRSWTEGGRGGDAFYLTLDFAPCLGRHWQSHCWFSQKLTSLNKTAILRHRVTLSREVNLRMLGLLAYLWPSLHIKLLLKGTGHATSYPDCLISTVPHSFSSNEFSTSNATEIKHVEPGCWAAVVEVGGERNN